MILLPNNCKCTEPFVHPSGWQTSPKTAKEVKALMQQDWYITYRFYDGEGKTKQITKRKWKKYSTLSDRQSAVRTAIETIKSMLTLEGYNPITGIASIPVDTDYEIQPRTPLCRALKQALARLTVEPKTRQDIKNILPHVEKACGLASCKDMPVSEVKRRHIIKVFDQLKVLKSSKWTANLFNHYRKYLKILFTELIRLQTIETNPIDEYFRKEKTVKKLRIVLTPEEKKIVHEKLKPAKYMRFRIYLNCFYHSGSRTTELFRMRIKDVNLDTQYFKVTIIKGAQKKEVLKPIKNIAVKYWMAAIEGGAPDDYVFGRGLKPGIIAARPDYITHFWYKVIQEGKKKVVVPTFYALKHLHSDEVSRLLDIETAQQHMDHTTLTTTKLYTIGETKRENERLKKLNNEF